MLKITLATLRVIPRIFPSEAEARLGRRSVRDFSFVERSYFRDLSRKYDLSTKLKSLTDRISARDRGTIRSVSGGGRRSRGCRTQAAERPAPPAGSPASRTAPRNLRSPA